MSAATWAWVTAARLWRRRRRRPTVESWIAERHAWIRAHAPGKAFADIGGLHTLSGDIAFRAEAAGASAVTLFDAGDPGYTHFERERAARGSAVRFVQGDLEEPASVSRIGRHDIVWCTGVLYHSPNPVWQLMQLRAITKELLYLGTQTLPELPGASQACIYYPHLPPPERRAYASAHWRPLRKDLYGIGTPFDDRPMHGQGNFWWGITRSALNAMLRTARFEVVEVFDRRDAPWLTELVARPIPEDPLLAPLPYFRQRQEARERGAGPLPFADYYGRLRPEDDS